MLLCLLQQHNLQTENCNLILVALDRQCPQALRKSMQFTQAHLWLFNGCWKFQEAIREGRLNRSHSFTRTIQLRIELTGYFAPCRMFATKCTGCGEAISSAEMVMRARGSVYHLHCFSCCMCHHQLQKGEEYLLHNNKLFCRHHYESIPHVPEAGATGEYTNSTFWLKQSFESLNIYFHPVRINRRTMIDPIVSQTWLLWSCLYWSMIFLPKPPRRLHYRPPTECG